MRKICDKCGYMSNMSLDPTDTDYQPIFGTFCSHCGNFSGPIMELPLSKENRLKYQKLKEECLRRVFNSKETENDD